MIADYFEDEPAHAGCSDDWIRREVLPALDALEANPSSVLTIKEAFANLDEEEESPISEAH